jgi:RNA polymerase sigma-70 factor (ECF subfamily)
VIEGARRLLARATNARGLHEEMLAPRLGSSLEKYLLSDDPRPSARAVNQFVDGLHADDLCLIIACERGDQGAWNDLVSSFGATVRSAARSAASNEDSAEDVAQSIWAELHGLRARDDGRPAGKIAYYSGRGSLGGWLRAVVAQLAVDQHRRQSRLVQPEEDADFDRLNLDAQTEGPLMSVSALADPAQSLENRRAACDVEAALERAIDELTPEDRLLIKLYYFDGLRLREAGMVLGVHEATASRRLARVQGQIGDRVRNVLTTTHGWTALEVDRSLAAVASHLESDLEAMLAAKGMAGGESVQKGD